MPIKDELPKRLLAGEKMSFDNPWSSFSPRVAPNALAKVKVYYSVTRESHHRDVEIQVCFVSDT